MLTLILGDFDLLILCDNDLLIDLEMLGLKLGLLLADIERDRLAEGEIEADLLCETEGLLLTDLLGDGLWLILGDLDTDIDFDKEADKDLEILGLFEGE